MNINEVYEKLLAEGKSNSGDLVKVETGLFSEEELIKVFSGYNELFFRIDKTGLFEIINEIISKISKLPKNDDFNHMIDTFNILQKEINNYYGINSQENRLSFYMKNGATTDNEDVRICSMSQIKGKGIAQCAEKAALANNILLILNSMGLFNYKVNYINALTTIGDRETEGHAFLEFDRINSKGETVHIIYDITNPEIVLLNGEEFFYPAVYSLTNDEYEAFLDGGSFDNSKFIVANYFPQKEIRVYSGFEQSSDKIL